MKPRGLMIIHQFRPVAAGAELQAERLAIKLSGLGHSMGVLTQLRTPNTPGEETLEGVSIHRVPFSLAYWVRRNGVVGTFRYLVKNRHKYDVLHVHQAFGHAVVAVVAARLLRKRCIIKIACAGEYGDLHVFSKFRSFDRALRVLHHADAVVAISTEVEQELLQWGFSPERILRIPNGVDTQYFSRTVSPPSREKIRFALVGRRHPQKGIDVALEAAKLLQEGGLAGKFEILLYGVDYPEFDYLGMAERLGVSGAVRFLPFQNDMIDVFQSVHCLILPSRGEGLSNALLEAMSMELPVIATSVSGTVDVVTDGEDGILIPPECPDALAKAMTAIIRYPELARALGKNARSKVECSFSLDFVASQYAALYESLFNR
jgi:glycosyltransferase involved in cell wall biosynthesis